MLVLIGVAVACSAALFLPHVTKSSVASKLAEANHPVACLPLWVPVLLAANTVSSQERLVYNRIPKAGSSFMISTLAALSKTNHFTLENTITIIGLRKQFWLKSWEACGAKLCM